MSRFFDSRCMPQLAATVSALALGVIATPAFAEASAASADEDAAEIIVTAQKRSENLQKVPAVIDVVSADDIRERGVTDLSRLTNLTTGILLTPQRSSLQIFSRGLGQSDGQVFTTASVEVDLDGINLPKTAQQLALFDIGSIQVLKGPQGILYGRNAIGGAVVVTTQKPELGRFAAGGSFEYGNYDYIHGQAAVSVPLGQVAAVRAAVNYEKHDGYLTNGANDLDSLAGRLTFVIEPSDRVSLTASALFVDRNGHGFISQTLPYAPAANGNPWFANQVPTTGILGPDIDFSRPENNQGYFNNKAVLLNANLTIKLTDELTFSYLPGYLNYKSEMLGATFYSPNGVLQSYQAVSIGEDIKEYSNEVRFNYDRPGIHVVAGALQHHMDAPFNFARRGYQGAVILNGPLDATENNYALFANADIDLTPTLRLTVGARQSWDRKGIDGTFGGRRLVLDKTNFPEFKNFSWKIGLSYDVSPDVMVYAHVQTGYLPGHYQTQPRAYDPAPAGLGLPLRVKEQTVTAYTAGFKSTFMDRRVTLNAEAFYYDYSNLHVNQRIPLIVAGAPTTVGVFANIKKARIYGADADLSVRIFENGRLSVGLALLDAQIVDSGFSVVQAMDSDGVTKNVADPSLHGYRLPFSPTLTVNLGYEHTFRLTNGGEVVATVASHHESERWLDYVHPNSVGALQGGFWKTDASLTYNAPEKKWYIGAWVRNLENSATYSGYSANSLRDASGTVVGTFGTATIDAPRTYGVKAGFNF